MQKKKILVADDDPGIVDAMRIVLEDEGYDVITTSDGKTIKKFYEQNPDLVFLDIWLSGMSGNIICRQLKEDKRTCNVPVIMFSANRDTQSISEECGADGFLAKPFDIKDLVDMVRAYTGDKL